MAIRIVLVIYKMIHVMRKPIFMRTTKVQISLRCVGLCSWAGRFESYLVENPEDRFSRHVAQIVSTNSWQYSSSRSEDKAIKRLLLLFFFIFSFFFFFFFFFFFWAARNHFRADTSRHWEEFICKVSTKFLQRFQGRCDKLKVKIKRLPAATFIDGLEPFSGGHN